MTDVPLTLAWLDSIGLPPYSARGLSQTLEPIQDSTQMRRTVNGKMVNLAGSQFQLYHSTISGNDIDPPAFDGVWPGRILTVDCIAELGYLTTSFSGQQRPSVDSVYRIVGDYTFYRPRLIMMVISPPNMTRAEWAAQSTWSIELEEVGGDT